MPVGAVRFDGSGNCGWRCTTPLPPTQNVSFVVFAYVETTAYTTIVQWANGAGGFGAAYQLFTNASAVEIWENDSSQLIAPADGLVPINTWVALGVSISTSTLVACAMPIGRGQAATYVTTSATQTFTPGAFELANDNAGDLGAVRLAGVKLWTAFLTPAQLRAEMAQLEPVRTGDLWDWWDLSSDSRAVGQRRRGLMVAQGLASAQSAVGGPPVPYDRRRPIVMAPPAATTVALEEYAPPGQGSALWIPAMPIILAMDEELAQAPPPTLVDEEYAPGAWATAPILSAALLSVDEEFAQQPVLALEELQPWAPALPLVLGMPAPVTDEELPQPPPPPGAAFEEYAPPPLLFALGPWTMPWLVDEELAQPPPPALVDEEYAPPLPPLFALAPPVLFAFDEEVAWQQVFEDYLPPLVFPAIVWAQSGAFYEQEFARAPTTVAIEEYAPGQQVAAPLVAAPPFAVFPLDQEFVQFVPPIVGSVVVDSIGVGHYIGLGHV